MTAGRYQLVQSQDWLNLKDRQLKKMYRMGQCCVPERYTDIAYIYGVRLQGTQIIQSRTVLIRCRTMHTVRFIQSRTMHTCRTMHTVQDHAYGTIYTKQNITYTVQDHAYVKIRCRTMHTLLIRYVVRYGTVRKAENWLYCSKGSFFHNTIVVTNTSPMQN